MMIELKPGDVILWPRDKAQGLYTLLLEWVRSAISGVTNNPKLADFAAKLAVNTLADAMNHKYIHAEITLLNNYLFGAWLNGTHLWKPTPEHRIQIIKDTSIFRPVVEIDEQKLVEAAMKYRNKPYDFTSLILNAAIEIGAFGQKEAERRLEELAKSMYSNPNALTCSELIARIFEDLGYRIERYSEYVTPDDIAQSTLFKQIK
ncbi:MAG: hypothetical protein QXE80_03640 [Pyrobaculum sp.]